MSIDMAQEAINRATATVTIHETGQLYLGVKVRNNLGIDYNDLVAVVFPNAGVADTDVRVKGFLNDSDQIYAGIGVANLFHIEGNSQRVDAIVESLNDSWEGESLNDRRWKQTPHLESESL